MKQVTPTVRLIGWSVPDQDAIQEYLDSIGADQWVIPDHDASSVLIEVMGRLCYRSWQPGLNPNVTKVRSDSADYLANIIKSGHGSVLEHVSFNWIFQDVSRVFTHELVRHRVGTAMSQESMRYVRLTDIPIWMPPVFAQDPDLERRRKFAVSWEAMVRKLEAFQQHWAAEFELDDPTTGFERKKQVTSGLRRLAPDGVATSIGWTCNVRELRHIIQLRTDTSAEEEIRIVAGRVAEICVENWPMLFGDLVERLDGSWGPPRGSENDD